MEQLKLTGTVTELSPISKGTSKNGTEWASAHVFVETHETYPKNVAIKLFGKTLDYNYDNLKIGDKIEVLFNLESRKWNDKVFTEATAWRIEKIEGDDVKAMTKETKVESVLPATPVGPNDLPF